MKYNTITSFILWVAWCESRGMDYITSTVLAALITGRSIPEAKRWIREPAYNIPAEIKLLDIYANAPDQVRMDIFGDIGAKSKEVGNGIKKEDGIESLSSAEIEKLYIAAHEKVKFLVDSRGIIQSHMAEAMGVGKHVINRLYSGLTVKKDLLKIVKDLNEIDWEDESHITRIYNAPTGRRRIQREEDNKNQIISELYEIIDNAGISLAKASSMLGGNRVTLRRCVNSARNGSKEADAKLKTLIINLRKAIETSKKI